MAIKKITYTEEIGESKRVSGNTFDDTTGKLIRPVDRLSPEALVHWDRIMGILSSVTQKNAIKHGSNGEDLTYIVNPALLMDYCTALSLGLQCRKLGN